MKKYFHNLFLALCFGFFTLSGYGQTQTAPPPPSGGHGLTGNQEANGGGGAPIGGGLFILLGLGAAYGGKKFYEGQKKTIEE